MLIVFFWNTRIFKSLFIYTFLLQCPPLNRITLGKHKSDNNNRIIQLLTSFAYYLSMIRPVISDYNMRKIPISVIQLCGAHFNKEKFQQISENILNRPSLIMTQTHKCEALIQICFKSKVFPQLKLALDCIITNCD